MRAGTGLQVYTNARLLQSDTTGPVVSTVEGVGSLGKFEGLKGEIQHATEFNNLCKMLWFLCIWRITQCRCVIFGKVFFVFGFLELKLSVSLVR